MTDNTPKPVQSTISRELPPPGPQQIPAPTLVPAFSVTIANTKPFPAVPTPPGLADQSSGVS
jgi:hypothetical protein